MPVLPMRSTRTWTSSRIWARYIVILAGDHIYKMDYEIMLRQHVDTDADVTIGYLEMLRRRRFRCDACGYAQLDGRICRKIQGSAKHS